MLRPPGTPFRVLMMPVFHVDGADGLAEAAEVERGAVAGEPEAGDAVEGAWAAGPPSPVDCLPWPVPAKVVMRPVVKSIFRIRRLKLSAT